jgi:protein-disulfide isomerase
MLGALAMALGAGGAVLAGSVQSPPVNTNDRAAIEKIVREYILTHPEILPEAMRNLEQREAKNAVSNSRKALETPFAGAWEGSANPDVTLVEFFDYNCGYCRAARPDIDRLLAEDPKIRIVYREVPILGPDSQKAARASLSAAQSGNYAAFHRAMFASGRASDSAISGARSKAGITDGPVDDHKIDAEINANIELMRTLQMSGTPSWVVGDQVLNGAVGYDALKAAIAEARAGGGKAAGG